MSVNFWFPHADVFVLVSSCGCFCTFLLSLLPFAVFMPGAWSSYLSMSEAISQLFFVMLTRLTRPPFAPHNKKQLQLADAPTLMAR